MNKNRFPSIKQVRKLLITCKYSANNIKFGLSWIADNTTQVKIIHEKLVDTNGGINIF